MTFLQDPPRLQNQFDDDVLLREHLERVLPEGVRKGIEGELRHLGELAANELYDLQLLDRENEPRLISWDPWGRRIDQVEVSELWKRAEALTVEHGLVAAAYEQTHGENSRTHQFAMNYVVQASLDVYSCPLAMTDGAVRTLLDLNHPQLIERAVPRLTSRDPKTFWTSGQWMTEKTGGSDVGLSETVAKKDGDVWRLYGDKWFTSAVSADMALTLGRPEGNGPGGRGLAVFYVELRDQDGKLNGITVNRLKDKLGTRKVPTAELHLEGTIATPVKGLTDGVKNISSMLNITRTWNSCASAWAMQRGYAIARDFAKRRHAFGAKLEDKPLHVDTLAGVRAETDAAFLLAFRTIQLLGRIEAQVATEGEIALLRALTPIAKLTTGKQAVEAVSEAIECVGGAGYVEDTGLPRVLADAHVLPIWEGTTNVLSLDLLRALSKGDSEKALSGEFQRALSSVAAPELKPLVETVQKSVEHARGWLKESIKDAVRLESGARRFALTIGRSLELALMLEHANWCLSNGKGNRAAASARRFAAAGIDQICAVSVEDSKAIV